MGTTTHCVCISLDYILKRGGANEMAGLVRISTAPDRTATEAEILTLATICKAKGYEVMPACDNHDERGYCKGHRKEA